VVELIEDGLGDDATLKDANNKIGQFCVDM